VDSSIFHHTCSEISCSKHLFESKAALLCLFLVLHLELELFVQAGSQLFNVTAVTEHTVLTTTPVEHSVFVVDGHTMIVASCDCCDFDFVFAEVVYTLGCEVGLEITVA